MHFLHRMYMGSPQLKNPACYAYIILLKMEICPFEGMRESQACLNAFLELNIKIVECKTAVTPVLKVMGMLYIPKIMLVYINSLQPESCHDANSAAASDDKVGIRKTLGFPRQSWHHNNSWFSVSLFISHGRQGHLFYKLNSMVLATEVRSCSVVRKRQCYDLDPVWGLIMSVDKSIWLLHYMISSSNNNLLVLFV